MPLTLSAPHRSLPFSRRYECTERTKWFFEFCAQCIVVIDMREWTKDTEAALVRQGEGNENAMKEWYDEYCHTLTKTVELVKGKLTKLQRRCIGTLIVVDVHNRDVIEILDNAKCDSPAAFEWNMQLRYYWVCLFPRCQASPHKFYRGRDAVSLWGHVRHLPCLPRPQKKTNHAEAASCPGTRTGGLLTGVWLMGG